MKGCLPCIPVVNGILPRPGGGTVRGVFLDRSSASILREAGGGDAVFLSPFVSDLACLYPVGVVARVERAWVGPIYLSSPPRPTMGVFAVVRGVCRARASRFQPQDDVLVAGDVEEVDLDHLRAAGHPCICGAGWRVLGGQTEVRSLEDIRVTVHGVCLGTGRRVGVAANASGLASPEQAHSVEHGIVRALQQWGLCTPRTLSAALTIEMEELKRSVEVGFRDRVPEVFGVTRAGACGNPLTNLAHFYLAQEFLASVDEGRSLPWSMEEARRRTLSHLVQDLEVTTRAGLRILQGLKLGMLHEDMRLSPRRAAAILRRFPSSPWD